MNDTEQQKLVEQLERFSALLRKRTREFHETGRFSDSRGRFLTDIERRNDRVRARVSQAAQSRNAWAFVKAELWRDYETMVNEFLTLDDGIDAEALKKTLMPSRQKA